MTAASMDLLNDALKRAAERLYGWNKSVQASVVLDTAEGVSLAWGNSVGSWGFFVCYDGKDVRLLEASVEYRILAAEAMPSLAVRIHELASIKEERIRNAIAAADTAFQGAARAQVPR